MKFKPQTPYETNKSKYTMIGFEYVERKETQDMAYGIKITYSWGDEENMDNYGKFKTEEEAFEKACVLAGTEAYVYNEGMDEDRTAVIYVDGYNKRIDLHYDDDDTWCYYRIEKY